MALEKVYLKTYLSNTPNTLDQIQIQIHGLKFDQIQIQIRRICICICICKYKYAFDPSPANDTLEPKQCNSSGPFCQHGSTLTTARISNYIHFYPRPVLVFGYCRCLRLSFCVSVRPSVCVCDKHLLVRAMTHHPFKLGSLYLDHRCKRPWLRFLLFWGVIDDLDLQGVFLNLVFVFSFQEEVSSLWAEACYSDSKFWCESKVVRSSHQKPIDRSEGERTDTVTCGEAAPLTDRETDLSGSEVTKVCNNNNEEPPARFHNAGWHYGVWGYSHQTCSAWA